MNKKLLFLAGLAPLVAAPALVVASCSSSTTTDSTTGMTPEEAQAAKDAMNRAKAYLESKSYFFADKKPSEVDLSKTDLPALKPSQNFGFSTKYFDKDFKDNDETGEKSIRIQVSRGEIKLADQYAVLKLKSSKADETDAKTNIDELINLDPVKDEASSPFAGKDEKTTVRRSTVFVDNYSDTSKSPEASKISEFIEASKDVTGETWKKLFFKEDSDEKIVSNGVTLGWKSLIKKGKKDLTDVNFIVSNVKQTQVGSILAPSITFDLQLKGDDKTSGIVQVNLVGFRLDEGYKDQVQPLLEQAATEYGTLYSPIIDDKQSTSKKASEIKNAENPVEELQKYLLTDWNIMGGDLVVPISIKVEIAEVMEANDSEGSLKVKFNFTRDGGTTPASTTKEIKLFGFQLPQQ